MFSITGNSVLPMEIPLAGEAANMAENGYVNEKQTRLQSEQ